MLAVLNLTMHKYFSKRKFSDIKQTPSQLKFNKAPRFYTEQSFENNTG